MIPSIDLPTRAVYDEIVTEVHRFNDLVYRNSAKQFTIDFFEGYLPELVCEPSGWSCSSMQFADCVGALAYKVDCICEVLDKSLPDFQLFSQFKSMLDEWKARINAVLHRPVSD